VVQELEGAFHYRGSWRRTYITSKGLADPGNGKQQSKGLRIRDFYSDLLYQPWFCATTPLRPQWLEQDNLERRSGLSAADFRRLYELPNKPVILTDQARTDILATTPRHVHCITSASEALPDQWRDAANLPQKCNQAAILPIAFFT
jgi:hypothetical protein